MPLSVFDSCVLGKDVFCENSGTWMRGIGFVNAGGNMYSTWCFPAPFCLLCFCMTWLIWFEGWSERTYRFMLTDLGLTVKQVLTTLINKSQLFIPDGIHCHSGMRKKASTALFTNCQAREFTGTLFLNFSYGMVGDQTIVLQHLMLMFYYWAVKVLRLWANFYMW